MCLEKGADPAVLTREGENGLTLACRNNVYGDVLELLFNHAGTGNVYYYLDLSSS